MDDNAYRISFPEDEARLSWLPLLLDAYAIFDEGIVAAVKSGVKKLEKSLACKKGCSTCCRTHKDIPVYPLELVGLYWFVIEKMARPERGILRDQLLNYSKGDPCPFLMSGSCGVHPMRPAACRQFNVFGKACAEGEDPFYTRRSDVLTPIRDYADRAFSIMLPFYGISEETARARAVKNGFIHTQVKVLQSCKWKELSRRMDEFDFRNV